jgi:hypothetical protein
MAGKAGFGSRVAAYVPGGEFGPAGTEDAGCFSLWEFTERLAPRIFIAKGFCHAHVSSLIDMTCWRCVESLLEVYEYPEWRWNI